nr:hypothetical protein [Tanacetum cinerariifolium]
MCVLFKWQSTPVVDYEDEYQGELQGDSQEDKLTTAMMLLARAITQKFSTPTNNHLRTSSNTRNQAVIQDGRVDTQTKNAGYDGNVNRNAGRQYKNQASNAGTENDENNQIVQPDDNAASEPSYNAAAVSKLAKTAFKEQENRYLEDICDLEEKLSSHDRIVYKMGQSIPTIHMLGKEPDKVYDPFLKAGVGYKNPKRLKKAIAAQSKMYDGEMLHSTSLKLIYLIQRKL